MIPNGNRTSLCWPHRVLKVVRNEDSGLSFSCQYPDQASNLLKNLAPVIFNTFGSRQMRSFPLGFSTTKELAQSVCSMTLRWPCFPPPCSFLRQLNEGETDALLIDPQNSPNLSLSVKIGQNDICFSRSVWNLGVIFDDKLLVKYVSPPTWNCVELAQLLN